MILPVSLHVSGLRSPSVVQRKSTRLQVKNLPKDTTAEELRAHFMRFGELDVCIPWELTKSKAKSQGQGFITFTDTASAETAVAALDNTEFRGNRISVQLAQPLTPGMAVLVGNLPYHSTIEEVEEFFSKFGPVVSVHLQNNRLSSKHAGYGFVEFRNSEHACNAVQVANGMEFRRRRIKVEMVGQRGLSTSSGKQQENEDLRAVVRVDNLPDVCVVSKLSTFMAQYGHVKEVKIPAHPTENRHMGYGLVTFANSKQADFAVAKASGQPFSGRPVVVRPSQAGLLKPAPTKRWTLSLESFPFPFPDKDKLHTVFVSNLSDGTTAKDLGTFFERFGNIREVYMSRKDDGTSAGYGFVNFMTANDAQLATREADGSELGRRAIRCVMVCRWTAIAPENIRSSRLHVNNLPACTMDEDVYNLFRQFGELTEIKLVRDKHTDECEGYGFVEFMKMEDAAKAVKKTKGASLRGNEIAVAFANPDRKKKWEEGMC